MCHCERCHGEIVMSNIQDSLSVCPGKHVSILTVLKHENNYNLVHLLYAYINLTFYCTFTNIYQIRYNDALNRFSLRLYGVEHMVKDIGYSFRLAARVLLYAPPHRQDSTYHGLFTPVVEDWLEREIAQWVHHEGSIRRLNAPST